MFEVLASSTDATTTDTVQKKKHLREGTSKNRNLQGTCATNGFSGSGCTTADDFITITVGTDGWQELEDYCLVQNCCNGDKACNNWPEGNTVTVWKNSCNGIKACYGHRVGSGTVFGESSCDGDFACSGMGRVINVGANSCVGRASCSSLGVYGNSNPKIGPGSCIGPEACWQLGPRSSTIEIGSSSCIVVDDDFQPCSSISKLLEDPYSVIIGSNSCHGRYSCERIAHSGALDVNIGNNVCQNDRQCQHCGTDTDLSVIIHDDFDGNCGTGETVTKSPTLGPTLSTQPSLEPTMLPTLEPTQAPTTGPTKSPSTSPSTSPSVSPSSKPSTLPSTMPTMSPTSSPTVGTCVSSDNRYTCDYDDYFVSKKTSICIKHLDSSQMGYHYHSKCVENEDLGTLCPGDFYDGGKYEIMQCGCCDTIDDNIGIAAISSTTFTTTVDFDDKNNIVIEEIENAVIVKDWDKDYCLYQDCYGDDNNNVEVCDEKDSKVPICVIGDGSSKSKSKSKEVNDDTVEQKQECKDPFWAPKGSSLKRKCGKCN